LNEIGVETNSPDGFRIFPKTHQSTTIIDALKKELQRLEINISLNSHVTKIISENQKVIGVEVDNRTIYYGENIILATGGLGYPSLGATGDGFKLSAELGHKITPLYPAMLPLFTKERWQSSCRADTIPNVEIKINLPKYKRYKINGDLIFTSTGLRGPIILDFSREITPLLDKYKEIPISINMLVGKSENNIFQYLKKAHKNNPNLTIITHLNKFLPISLLNQLAILLNIDLNISFNKLNGEMRDRFIKIIFQVPFNIIGHNGFKSAMITRGGISLKEINPKTMESKIIENLYFCGEIIDLDGMCGGYNLQLAFSTGYLAGQILKKI